MKPYKKKHTVDFVSFNYDMSRVVSIDTSDKEMVSGNLIGGLRIHI